jgi:hypothetical protein
MPFAFTLLVRGAKLNVPGNDTGLRLLMYLLPGNDTGLRFLIYLLPGNDTGLGS